MMKNMYKCGVLLLCVLFTTACESWLDVQPRTKIKSDDLFETEAGFKDALMGAYTLMKAEPLYGRELTFGFTEVVTGVYTNMWNNTAYKDVSDWKYEESSIARSKIDGIWSKMYNMLANVNNLLDNIDGRSFVFTADNYNIIKGEALGLRAYAHFDLLRLFGSAVDLNKQAIPYVKTLQIEVPQVYTSREIIGLLHEDIRMALDCLKEDPVRNGKLYDLSGDGFMNDRQKRMNYYAVKALQARVAMWEGNLTLAKEAALEVLTVADTVFPWVTVENVSSTEEKSRDYSFATEHIFALDVHNLQTLTNTWLYTTGSNLLYCGYGVANNRYELRGSGVGVNDYRLNYTMKRETEGNNYSNLYIYKYYQPEGYKKEYSRRMPLIRRSEMTYIVAECLIDEDPATGLEYLNEVRRHRGILTDLTDPDKLRSEITKEYGKEFLAEGQLFYYYKRNQLAKFPESYKQATEEDTYLLPLPELEKEFGDYYTVDNSK